MAKTIGVAITLGGTYNTLPGSQGSMSFEGEELEDTVFGQVYKSSFPGMVNWSVEANAIYKGFAGYMATIKKISGASTSFVTEAMSLVSGKTYRITNAAKNLWDKNVTTNVFDNAVNQNANVQHIDFLTGAVTFKSTYTVVGPVTAGGRYYGTVAIAKGRSFTLTMSAEGVDNSDLATAQSNSGHRTFQQGLKTVSLEISGVHLLANGFQAELLSRAETIIEINPDGAGQSIARGYFRLGVQGQEGDVGALEEETITYKLSVGITPATLKGSFSWLHSSTTLSQAVIDCLDNFEDEANPVFVTYLPDGTNGVKGPAIITDISLSGGLDAMNEFSVTFQGSGALTAVP